MGDTNVKDLLQEVHLLLAKKFKEELTMERDEPIPGSVYSVIVSFLRNNDITADVRSSDDLADLKEMLIQERAEDSESKASGIIDVADKVSDIMGYGSDYIN